MIQKYLLKPDLIKALLLICTLSAFTSDNLNKESSETILWYMQPAKKWTEALPIGNGRIGAMVFGDPTHERIQLNDDSLWPADLGWEEPEGNKEDLQKIRELLFEGNNSQADKLFVEKFSNKTVVRSHQTLGDLHIEFNHKEISDYKRSLDINQAVANVSYLADGNRIQQKMFASHPDRVIMIEISSEKINGLNAKIRLSRPEDNGFKTFNTKVNKDQQLVMQGEVTQRGAKFRSEPAPILEGVKFETLLKIQNEGGEIINGEDYLELNNVHKATFYLVSNSSFYSEQYMDQNITDLKALENKSFNSILETHIKDYQQLYSRVDLKLGNRQMESIPTDQRVERVRQGSVDLGLEETLFQYGRYLLISSSRKGTNPANLQGLWNDHIEAPWNADYHLNINLQMNYWLADVTNLGELNEPLFDYIDKLIVNGKKTAKKNFGCNGAYLPHATDLWAPTWLRAPTAYWGCSVGAGGWLMQHYWQHYEYTKDHDFLKNRAFPAIQEVAHFYSDWLIEDRRDGTLISAPSTSPENRFINEKGEKVATCLGSAMDQQVISEVFDNYMQACEILQLESPLLTKIKVQREKLRPGFILDQKGKIMEWDREYEEPEPGHRHMSHLYGFHPGNSVSKEKNPKIFDAVKKTLDFRLENGGAGTGWSRAWLINCSARLLDGDMAHEHIQLLFKKSMLNNLFDSHPPFQIDGNFGYTAGISEMLLQSHEENILRLLPALPSKWKEGHVKGLKARGGLTVDIYWSENKLDKAIIYSKFDSKLNLFHEQTSTLVSLKKGEAFAYNAPKK